MGLDKENSVLVVDDEPGRVSLSLAALEKHGFNVDGETKPLEAVDSVRDNEYDAVVSDYEMPKMNGIEFLEKVRSIDPELPFILFTGRGSEEVASEAISKGVTDYFQKDTDGLEKYEKIASTLDDEVEDLGKSIYEKAMESTDLSYTSEETIANTPHSIMVTDEDGTIVCANQAVAETSEYSKDELIGDNPSIFQSGQHPDEFYDKLWSTIKDGEVWEGRIVNQTKEGDEYTIDQTITPVEFGRDTYFVAINKPTNL